MESESKNLQTFQDFINKTTRNVSNGKLHDWKDDHHYGKKTSNSANDEMIQMIVHYGRHVDDDVDVDF